MQLFENVVSSNISKVGFNDNGIIVEYKSGVKYLYKGAKRDLYEELLKAESKGKFVNQSIKGKYEFEKVA